jgi:hypothetical protein
MSSISWSDTVALQLQRIRRLARLRHRQPRQQHRTPRSSARRSPPTPGYLAGAGSRLRHVVFGLLLLLSIFVVPHWYNSAPESTPELGVSFSCAQVRYLGDDCRTAFAALLSELGVRHVRLSLFWSDVEPGPGQFDFSETDALSAMAAAAGADVLLTVGIKAQRYPEVYLPAWLVHQQAIPAGAELDRLPGVHDALLQYVRAAVAHYGADPAVIGWQVENEPFLKNFSEIHGWRISPAMTADEAAAVRDADPAHRPVVVTHSAWTVYDRAWKTALSIGDVLGENVFTKKAWLADWSYFFPYEMGPWVPDLPGQATAARRAGKQLWITELQAEPEEKQGLSHALTAEARSMSPRLLLSNLELARRSGATRVYLWGAEWWFHERGTGGAHDLWATAAAAFKPR